MSKHTPGPWLVDIQERQPLRVLADDARATIVAADLGNPHNETALADARLIAAAPDLLEALKAFAEYFGPLEDNIMLADEVRNCYALARAAIAKAEAET